MRRSEASIDDDALSSTVEESVCVDFPASYFANELDRQCYRGCLSILSDSGDSKLRGI
jgi:hypothetical protein